LVAGPSRQPGWNSDGLLLINGEHRTSEVPVAIALAWGLIEAGLTPWDIYETGSTLADPLRVFGSRGPR
jgi:hypothetical protein